MAWQQIDLQNGKINMSKVVPLDNNLATFDKKQAYYHNNRLTALRKYVTDEAVGYRCYKRKAGTKYNTDNEQTQESGYTVDGEDTDYIEINAILVGGTVKHLLDVAAKYYKVENAEKEGSSEHTFIHGFVIDDTYIGSIADWSGFKFYKFTDDVYICYNSTSGEVRRLVLYHKMETDLDNNRQVVSLGQYSDYPYVFRIKSTLYFCTGMPTINTGVAWDPFNYVWKGKLFTKSFFCPPAAITYYGTLSGSKTCKVVPLSDSAVSTSSITVSYTNTGNEDVERSDNKDAWDSSAKIKLTIGGITYFQSSLYIYKCIYYPTEKWSTWDGKYNLIHRVIVSISQINPDTGTLSTTTSDSGMFYDYEDSYTQSQALALSTFSIAQRDVDSDKLTLSYINTASELGAKLISDGEYHGDIENTTNGFVDTSTRDYSKIDTPAAANHSNDTVILKNGFVLNYNNDAAVTIGHRYKVICRLDTTGAEYLGDDDTYVYVKQFNTTYKISLAEMFPDTDYNAKVNIIENGDYCQEIGGYYVFNTTTYLNAIYDDDPDKVVCSCDDWNGRYYSTSTTETEDPQLLATSRITPNGKKWNAQASGDIPVTISMELTEIYEFVSPTYHWANEEYTMHEGVKAYIYKQADTQTDIKTATHYVTSEGFFDADDTTLEYEESNPLEIVPSILFVTFLKSEQGNYIQVGSTVYKLMTYTNSTGSAMPALCYQENPQSITTEETDDEFVIQGTLYQLGGASNYRHIIPSQSASSETYCCDITGLKYLGYDSTQAYFFSPATGVIYTFNGANKLNSFLEIDKRNPIAVSTVEDEDDETDIEVCNIPSINLVAMAFTDGVLIICNEQSVFIDVQTVSKLAVTRKYGLIRINSSYYYFGTNTTITDLYSSKESEYQEELAYFDLKTAKIGTSRLQNTTCSKHRLVIYSDMLTNGKKTTATVTLTGVLGNKSFSESFTKQITSNDLLNNEYQWEFNPKNTKATYFQTEIVLENADLLEYWMDINETTEENLVRK